MKTNTELHNSELRELYSSLNIFKEVDDYNKNVEDESKKVAYPLFIKANESYEEADIKLMIFGQETYGWGDKRKRYGSGITADEVINEYDKFFNTKYCYTYDGQFWNGIKHFINELQKKDPKIDYLWNNVVKMGYDEKGFPYDFYDSIVKPHLNELITKEIEILKPDYIIFFTGPNYDYVLNDVFNKPERKIVKEFPERELCEIIIPDIKKAFRTYHPNYLYRNDIDKYLNPIIEEITSDIQLRRT